MHEVVFADGCFLSLHVSTGGVVLCGRLGSLGAVGRVLWWQRSGCYNEVALVGVEIGVKECGEWLGEPHGGGWQVMGGAHRLCCQLLRLLKGLINNVY